MAFLCSSEARVTPRAIKLGEKRSTVGRVAYRLARPDFYFPFLWLAQ